MSNSFPIITIEDKNNTSIFEKNTPPALIVEGKTDVKIYSRLLKSSVLNWSNFDIVVGENKSQILNYHYGGKIKFEYVALVDSDYDRYNGKCKDEDRLIFTHFYNMENYLTTEEVLSEAIEGFNAIHTKEVSMKEVFTECLKIIRPFIISCLLKNENGWSMKLEDSGLENEQWWLKNEKRVCPDLMKKYIINYLAKKGVVFTEQEWDENGNRLYELAIDKNINIVVSGKRMIEAVFFAFWKLFPDQMEGRDQKVFTVDLARSIHESPEALKLVEIIDSKLGKLH